MKKVIQGLLIFSIFSTTTSFAGSNDFSKIISDISRATYTIQSNYNTSMNQAQRRNQQQQSMENRRNSQAISDQYRQLKIERERVRLLEDQLRYEKKLRAFNY